MFTPTSVFDRAPAACLRRVRILTPTATFVSLLAAALTMITSAIALADPPATACVGIDTAEDGLGPDDQRSALTLLRQTFRAHGVEVVDEGCEATYTAVHARLGTSYFVTLEGPHGILDHRALVIEELPAVYDQLVGAVLSGRPIERSVDRDNVTIAQDEPRRMQADSLFYARLGYGYAHGGEGIGGPAFGLGWRYELNRAAVDLSFANLVVADNEREAGVGGTIIRLGGYWFAHGGANHSPYLGGALGWGVSDPNTQYLQDADGDWDGPSYYGNGLHVDISGGYEFLRASTVRLFIQGDVSLPVYKASLEYGFALWQDTGASRPWADEIWAPTFSLSLGLGFERRGRRR